MKRDSKSFVYSGPATPTPETPVPRDSRYSPALRNVHELCVIFLNL